MSNQNQSKENEIYNLLSHKSLLIKSIKRLISDSWNKIISNPDLKKFINKLNENLNPSQRINIALNVYKVIKKYKFNFTIQTIYELFHINPNDIKNYKNKIDFGTYKYETYLIYKILDDKSCIDVDDIINKWINSQKDFKFDHQEKHYKGSTPIKTRKPHTYFTSKKVFHKYELKDINWRELAIYNKAIHDLFYNKEFKLGNYNEDTVNKFIYDNILKENHKCYTIIHINQDIETWKIIAERKVNVIIQFNNLKYENSFVKYNKFNFGEKNYITNKKYNNFITFLSSLGSYVNEYKSFQIPGSVQYVRKELFGYIVVSYINEKIELLKCDIPYIKFKIKKIKINKQPKTDRYCKVDLNEYSSIGGDNIDFLRLSSQIMSENIELFNNHEDFELNEDEKKLLEDMQNDFSSNK